MPGNVQSISSASALLLLLLLLLLRCRHTPDRADESA